MFSSNQKGAIAELEIAAAAAKLGVEVYRPVSGHSRADLVLDIAGRLMRVQCKWGRLSQSRDVVVVHTGGCRISSSGYVRTTYTIEEVDLFGIYCGELDRCFLVPTELVAGKHGLQLRLSPPRNNQRSCINLAEWYELPGAIAQLGERCRGTAEVAGSIPASSTPSTADLPVEVGVNRFRDQLGYWMDQAAAGVQLTVTRHGRPLVRLATVAAPALPMASPPLRHVQPPVVHAGLPRPAARVARA